MKTNDLSQRIRSKIRHLLVRGAESLRISRWSRPSVHAIEDRLRTLLPRRGFFVEAGAFDGKTESNTYYLERIRGWRGLLVEPMPGLSAVCRKTRPRSVCINAALVPLDHDGSDIQVTWAGTATTVAGSLPSEIEAAHFRNAANYTDLSKHTVPGRSLSSLIDELELPRIDFLSLDVEGFEMQVLAGIDFQRHAPGFILIEALNQAAHDEQRAFLVSRNYEYVEAMTPRDHLYRLNHPLF